MGTIFSVQQVMVKNMKYLLGKHMDIKTVPWELLVI